MKRVDTAHVIEVLAEPAKFNNVTYYLSEEEFVKGCMFHPKVRARMRFAWVFVLFALGIAAALIGNNATAFGIGCAVVAVIYPFVIVNTFKSSFRKAFASMDPIAVNPIELTYGEGFVAQKAGGAFGYNTWLYQVVRNKDFRLMGTSDQIYVVVPVRAFADAATLAEFDRITRELAEGRVLG